MMPVLFVILLCVVLWGVRPRRAGSEEYMGREQTTAIKGIFAIIILFSHMRGYLPAEFSGGYYGMILSLFGQSMVVMFLFYSGFGIMEALKKDERKYRESFFRKRILKIWVLFAVAVGLFAVLNIAIGKEYSLRQWLLCWTGWESIGNSNWFVFDILVLYLLTYLILTAATRAGMDLKSVATGVFVLSLAFIVLLYIAGKGTYWYDTVLAYPMGMLFSLHSAKNQLFKWGGVICAAAVYVLMDAYVVLWGAKGLPGVLVQALYILIPLLFTYLVVALTTRLRVGNRVLMWLGTNAFGIYILQRLAMILSEHVGLNEHGLVFAAVVIPATMFMAVFYNALTGRILKYV